MKRQKTARALSAVLAASMILACLAGCGKNGSSGDGYVYVPEYTELQGTSSGMGDVCVSGDVIYYSASIPVDADGTPLTQDELDEYNSALSSDTTDDDTSKFDDVTYITKLYKVNMDGTGQTELTDYVAPVAEDDCEYSYAGLDNMLTDEQGNIWVLESYSTTYFNLPEGFDSSTDDMWKYYDHDEQTYAIRKLSGTGAELTSIDIGGNSTDTSDGSYYYINYMALDSDGNVYIADSSQDSNGNISVYSGDGTKICSIASSEGNYINGLTCLSDGKVYASCSADDGDSKLCPIDISSGSFGAEKDILSEAWNISSGGSLYDFCYSDGSSLYGYNFGAESPDVVITWINSDIDSNSINYSTILDDGNLLAISSDYNDDGTVTNSIIKLVRTPESEVQQKDQITLGVMYLDYNLRSQVLKFNKSNDEYHINVIDYSQYNTDDDYTAGLTKLNTEIIAGNAPDIIAIDDFSYDLYSAKGVLEDLYPYIDNDPDLSRDDFIQSILKVQETDGKLYHLGTCFSLISIAGSSSLLGSDPGWTISEMQDVLNSHPEADCALGQNMTRDELLNVFLLGNIENYINWETGECNFDCDEFKNLLALANTYPSSDDLDSDDTDYIDESELIAQGRQIMSYAYLYDFTDIEQYTQLYGDSLVFKGLPSTDSKGNLASIYGDMAMTTTCKYKDGAWQFMRTMFTEDAQEDSYNGFPINQKVFDDRLADAMKQDDDDDGGVTIYNDGTASSVDYSTNYSALTQAQADQLVALIDSVEHTIVYDEDILDLINDETSAYFSGEKTVDDVASIIQSRMNIYINEQR